MKRLERLAAGQLNDLERLSMEELCNFVGGSGCVWDALGYAYSFCDGIYGNEGKQRYVDRCANDFAALWGSIGGPVNANGDPDPHHKEQLFKFVSAAFKTSGSCWETSGWNSMINGSDCGMALVFTGDDKNQHASIISGERQEESDPRNPGGKKYYYLDQNGNKVYEEDIKYGTGLSEKE